MSTYIEQFVKNCGRCVTRKTIPKKVAPLNHLTSSGPFDLVCIDFLSIEPVLIVTDHFTCYTQVFAAKDQKALTVAKILFTMAYPPVFTPIREEILRVVS